MNTGVKDFCVKIRILFYIINILTFIHTIVFFFLKYFYFINDYYMMLYIQLAATPLEASPHF